LQIRGASRIITGLFGDAERSQRPYFSLTALLSVTRDRSL
jgi:hypothetical protein